MKFFFDNWRIVNQLMNLNLISTLELIFYINDPKHVHARIFGISL